MSKPKINFKQLFTDLYRDLDDRHLLLPAIALVIAIIAVPVLLGGSASEAPMPVAAAPLADDDATAVESAVLTGDPGIREYSKRLEALKEKNPFVQQFAPKEPGATESSPSGPSPESGAAAGLPAGSPIPSDASTSDAGGGLPTGSPVGGEPTTTTTTTTTDEGTSTQTFILAPRVDVTFGELGDAKEIDDVRYFDFLPNEKLPVAAFLGLGDSADKAVFGLSNEVVETKGEGTCAPHEADGCDMLILREGEQRILKLVDGTTYRLKVRDAYFARVPDPRDEESGTPDDPAG